MVSPIKMYILKVRGFGVLSVLHLPTSCISIFLGSILYELHNIRK